MANWVNDDALDNRSIPRHYIDQPFDIADIDTPLFDQIVKHQLNNNDELYTYMLAFIGRLFYDVGQYDNFEIMPFIVGDCNTGKSTIIDVIRAMFSSSSVGVMDSTLESIFGLQSQCDKEIVVGARNKRLKWLISCLLILSRK